MPTRQMISLPEFGGSSGSDDSDLLKELRSTHPTYKEYAPRWQFYLSAYEGGKDFTQNADNLFKHFRENGEDFAERLKRVHYMNYCEVMVDYYTNFIFSEPIDRNGGKNSDFFLTFTKDVNKKGDNIDSFMRLVSEDSQVFGMSYILVDAPRKETLLSQQQEQEQGIRPYWVLIKPEEVIHWSVDEFDQFEYLKRKQLTERFLGGRLRFIERYTEYTKEEIRITEVDVTDPSKPEIFPPISQLNELGKIPIEVARWKRSKIHPHMGKSFLTDFADNNREIYNLTSLLQEFLYRQAFNILVMETDGSYGEAEQSEDILSTNNVLQFPKGGTAPSYIYPPAEPAKFIQDERGRIKNEMFARAAQDTINEMFNGEKSSGFSQAQSFSKTVPYISARADMLESVENRLMALTMEMAGKEWDGKVKYKDRYELTNLNDALTQLQILVRDLALPSETFVKEELKRMVREYDGKLPKETLAKIEKEIEGMTFKSWQETQKQALVGRGSSPGEQQKPKGTGTMAEAEKEAKVKTGATKKLKPQKEKAA